MSERLCADLEPAISEWIDGTLESDGRRRLETHLATCARCRTLADDLRGILHAARTLEDPAPPVQVWQAVERGLAAEQPAGRPGSPAWRASLIGLAAAAGLILTVGLGWSLRGRPAPAGTPRDLSSKTRTGGGSLLDLIEVELRATEEHFDSAVAGLGGGANAATDADNLEAQVAATFQESLAVIDTAIAESRAALEELPNNEPAEESLFAGMRRKVALLQDAIRLVNEMRKGDQDRTHNLLAPVRMIQQLRAARSVTDTTES